MLALEQRGNMLLGRPAEIVWLDEPNPQGAQQSAERLVEEHKVVGLLGGALSSFALAISSVAKKSKVPYVAANAAAGAITGASCNKYTFRLQPPVDVHTARARALLRDARQKVVSADRRLRLRPGHQEVVHRLHPRPMAAR